MIKATVSPGASQFAARLAQRAARLAKARGENRLRARAQDPARWRDARLLWPLFSQD